MKTILLLTLMLSALLGCRTAPVSKTEIRENPPLQVQAPVSHSEKEKVVLGLMASPAWSPDGLTLVYAAKKRPNHSNSQIYLLDVNSGKEKRITYSDGDAEDPLFVEDGTKIVYSSTTDELKERPQLLSKSPIESSARPGSELYLSDLAGAEIQRLTQHPGYDGHLREGAKNTYEFFFFSIKNDILQPFRFNLKDHSIAAVAKSPKVEISEFAQDQNQMAWLEGPTLFYASVSQKTPKTLTLVDLQIKDLRWIKNSPLLIFSQKLAATTNSGGTLPRWEIALFNTQTNCKKVLVKKTDADCEQATLSPDGKHLAFIAANLIETQWLDQEDLNCQSPSASP